MALVKLNGAIYWTLGALGLAASVLVPVVIYLYGTSGLPTWSSVASIRGSSAGR